MRHTTDRAGPFLIILLFASMASCGGSADGGSADADSVRSPTVVDSAGIEIVSSPAPLWPSETGWRVSETPDVTIGVAEGHADYTLYGVQAAIRLNDGRIAIANRGLSQVKIYDSAGEHLMDLGREGEGPGEFMLLADVWRAPGDSMVAVDNRLARLTVFDGDGEVGRTISLQQSETPRQLFGRRTLDDGSLLVSGAVRASEPPRVGLFDGGVREFDRYTADGALLNRVSALPQGRNWGFDTGGPYGPSYTSAPFTIFSPPHASDGRHVFLGDGTRAEVSQWSPEGRLVRIIRWEEALRPVTAELQDAYRALRMEGADTPENLQRAQQAVDGIVFPDYLPVYETLRTDSEGHVWVKPWAPLWAREERAYWQVFDPSGPWLGEVATPAGVNVLEIGRDYILGVVRDGDGVERVVSYGLDRGVDTP